MPYVVKDPCKCKYMDCVEVCPVDCFYEGENMLVIHPDECIDCGVCEPECPVDAIEDDSDDASKKWVDITENMEPYQILIRWENRPQIEDWKGVDGKFENHFSENLEKVVNFNL